MVDGPGLGAEKARCGLWCESGKVMGAQSGVREHPNASPVLAPHKLRGGGTSTGPYYTATWDQRQEKNH